MATKKKGTLTTSGEWAKHLRKFNKRKFWKGERAEAKKIKGIIPFPHPGEILYEFYIIPLNLTISDVCTKLKISEENLLKIVIGVSKITPSLASKLSKIFSTSKQYWLNLQNSYDQRS